MVGYSGTPLAKKLGIVDDTRVLTINAPSEFVDWLAPIPDRVALSSRLRTADVVVAFCVTEGDLMKARDRAVRAISPTGAIWICWPKKASGIDSPLQKRETMMEVMFQPGLVDIKIGAVSDVWSGLKFVVRTELRPDWDT